MDAFGKEYHWWMAIESVNQCSVLCIKSEMQSNDGLFKEYVYWRSNMSFKKVNEKIVLLQVKDLIHIVSSYIGLKKKLCTFLIPPVILLRGTSLDIVIGHQVLCSNKGTNWTSLFCPEGKQIGMFYKQLKAHFSTSTG